MLVQGDTKPYSLPTSGKILFYAKSNGVFYSLDSAGTETPIGGGSGTVTSVDFSGGATGLTSIGGPITTSGTITLGGTLAVTNGGTGATTQAGAANAVLPNQSSNSGKFLTTDGTNVSWATVSGTGTVTSVGVSSSGTYSAALTVGSSPVTSSGTITITPNLFGSSAPGIVPQSGGGTTNFLRADGTWAAPPAGTVTSVTGSGGTTGLTLTGGPITSSGTLTLGGTLDAANGGTGQSTYAVGDILYASTTTALSRLADVATGNALISGGVGVAPSWGKIALTTHVSGTLPVANGGTGVTTVPTNGQLLIGNGSGYTVASLTAGSGITITPDSGSISIAATNTGTVTSVSGSGGTTGLTLSGGPITSSGTLTLGGTLAIANGGTGATTQAGAANAVLPSQTGNTGKFLTTDGSNVSWATVSGTGTVTSVAATGNQGVTISGSPITSSGTITVGLGNITPTSVSTAGNLTFSATGQLITGDMSGAARNDRLRFQTNVTNGITNVTAIPNGTSDTSYFIAENNSNIDNNAAAVFGITTTGVVVNSAIRGTGTLLPLYLFTGSTSTDGITIDTSNNVNVAQNLNLAGKLSLAGSYGTAGQVLTSQGSGSNPTWTSVGGSGTVTSVGVSSSGTYSAALTVGSSPVTSSGTITITPNLFGSSAPGIVPQSGGGTTNFLRADGTWAAPSGSGTVTSVSGSGGTTGMTLSGGPITSSGTLTLGGTLAIANGGTGATTQAGARTNLGAAASGTNSDITSLTGLTTALSVAQGGTGAVTLTGYVKGNGTSAFTASASIPSTDITGLGTVSSINTDGIATHVLLGTGTFGNVPIGGSDTQILYNNSGASAGSSNFVYDYTNSTVKIGGNLNYIDSTKLSVVEDKNGFGQVLFQNKNSGVNASMNLAIVNNSAGTDYMAMGINSSNFSALYNTLFELPNAGYISNTTDVVIGAQSDHSSTSRTYFTYSSGSGAMELNENGALGWGASYNGTLTQANFGTSGQVLVSAGSSAPPAWTTIGGTGTVTSVGVSSSGTYSAALTIGSSPVTSSGTITITPNLFGNSAPGIVPQSGGGTTNFLRADGTWAAPGGGGSGTVTSVAATGSDDISVGGSPITTSGTLTFALTNTTVTANTYGSSTQVPVFSVDAKGRVTGVTNTSVSVPAEVVVLRYTSGGSGNLTAVDAIYSQTSGVTTTITDGANCIATYSFTGKSNPPKSVTMYGQNYTANTFSVTSWPATGAAAANYKVAGGGTSALPDLVTGVFTSSNLVTMQTRMGDTGASSTIGNRAWLVIVFGF
jgi:hypothetical protein